MLSFPNPSRIFDPTRRAVRFWGHDSAMEWSFFVTENALKRLQPNVERSEASLLSIGVRSGPQIGIQGGPPRFAFRAISVRPVGAGWGCGDWASAG